MISKPFEPQDILEITIQPAQAHEFITEIKGPAVTLCGRNNEPMAIIGITEMDKNRAVVWSFISGKAGPYMTGIVKAFKRLLMLYSLEYGRLEMLVKSDFGQGHRLAHILNFEREGTMRNFFEGHDYDLYGRIS